MTSTMNHSETVWTSPTLNMSAVGEEVGYDYTGAMYFTVAVVLVYGLSIVALIATHMRGGGHDTKEESRQISQYIQTQDSMRRKGEQERLLWLQGELGISRQLSYGDNNICRSINDSENLLWQQTNYSQPETNAVPNIQRNSSNGGLDRILEEPGDGLKNQSFDIARYLDNIPYPLEYKKLEIEIGDKSYMMDELLSIVDCSGFKGSLFKNQEFHEQCNSKSQVNVLNENKQKVKAALHSADSNANGTTLPSCEQHEDWDSDTNTWHENTPSNHHHPILSAEDTICNEDYNARHALENTQPVWEVRTEPSCITTPIHFV